MDDTGVHPIESPGHARGARRLLPLAILVVVALLLGSGAIAAFAVPVISLDSSRAVSSMLPASTAFYVSVDLNPSGATHDNWQRIIHAFSSQPQWKNIARLYSQGTSSSSTSNCYQQTQGQVSSNLGQLGHASAFAILDASGFRTVQAAGLQHSLMSNAVFLASLHIRMTVVQALSGFSLSLPKQTDTYRGVSIYQESFPSCGKVSSAAPERIYAALDKGYVVLGLQTAPIKRVIDVAEGAVPSLESQTAYHNLISHIPSGSLAGYYLNGSALKTLQSGQPFLALTGARTPATNQSRPTSSAAGVYADADGLRVATAMSASAASRITHPAGQIAAHLPASTLALVSLQNIHSTLQSLTRTLSSLPVGGTTPRAISPVLRDLFAQLNGELDVVMSSTAACSTLAGCASQPLAPFSLVWQVNSTSAARRSLARLAHQLGSNGRFHTAVAPNGTPYQVDQQGIGYAVQNGWAVISAQTPAMLKQLSSTPAAPLDGVAAFQQATAPGSTPGSVIYIDAHGLRTQLERTLLPHSGPSVTSTYNSYVLPVLAPIQTFASQSATSADGNYTLGTTIIRIQSPSS